MIINEPIRLHLSKMQTEHSLPIQYSLKAGDTDINFNQLIGKKLTLSHTGNIHCTHCGRRSNKSFSQGYCYPCFSKLAQCDSCMMSPERCHFESGTCREPEWAEQFCMTDHIVYLANSSGLKVGITRLNQVPTRWMDQGAIQALPIIRVATRQQSGLVEDALRAYASDRTNWRTMLKGEIEEIDLVSERDDILDKASVAITELQTRFGIHAIQLIDESDVYEFEYPVDSYPTKIKTHNLDKTPIVEGVLEGIKGQYLIFDTGVINIRKFTAYEVDISQD
jgi:hypothetical protein